MPLVWPTRASAEQILRVKHLSLQPFGYSAFINTRPTTARAAQAMFHRAVTSHSNASAASAATATNASNPSSQRSQPLKQQQLFPPSSPDHAAVTTSNQVSRPAGPSQKPLRPTHANNVRNHPYKPPTSRFAHKRTADGLAKALGHSGMPAFDDDSSCRQIQPTRINESTDSIHDVEINENDFDSDLDLEIEESRSKVTVTYPKLPKTTNRPTVTYPPLSQKAHMHGEAQTSTHLPRPSLPTSSHTPLVSKPPNSSIPLPWSSSPQYDHFQKATVNLDAYAYQNKEQETRTSPSNRQSVVDHGQRAANLNPRPAKRRTLPWLDTQEEVEPGEGIRESASMAHATVTPLAKDKTSKLPWNATASALKEQQRQLRKLNNNKRVIKENEGTDESRRAAIDAKKSKSVPRPLLSKEQSRVLDLVVNDGASIFFTGSAGTGKSVLLREIIAVLRKKYLRESDRVAITASTGLAACNIGGVTLHSFAGIGLGKEDVPELVKKIKRNQKAKHRWMRTKVLIVDEVSMVDGELFDKLEAVARTLRNNGRPFGGIQLVITGDFFQLPPVPDGRGASSTFAFDAKSWDSSIDHTIGLHHVFRQKDPVFAGMLNEMREGRLTSASIATFKQLARQPPIDDDLALSTTELFPTRNEVDSANRVKMNQLGGQPQIYLAKDGGTINDEAQRTKLLDSSLAPRELSLKKGAQVMLIKNIDETLVNGSLGKVIGFMSEDQFGTYIDAPDVCEAADPEFDLNNEEKKLRAKYELSKTNTRELWPVVRFAIADGTTRDLLCNRETWKTELPNGEIQAQRSQVPLILAWALSIHKAQGQTLERVKVDLGKVFEKGQAYVALSRATSIQGLQVLRFDASKVQAHPKVRTFYSNLARIEDGGN